LEAKSMLLSTQLAALGILQQLIANIIIIKKELGRARADQVQE
jgi:hypothetical protein